MEFTAQQIADFLGGTVEGDPAVTVSDVAKIEEARRGTLAFLANPKYAPRLYDTQASIVLIGRDFVPERPVAATLVRVADARAALARLLSLAASAQPRKRGREEPSYVAPDATLGEDVYVGAFAYVGPGAKIGSGVQIYPQAYVGDGSTIGDGTILYAGAKVYAGCAVGARCILHAGCVIGADGFGFAPDGNGYAKVPQIGNVVIEDDVEIGANTTIDRATMGATRVCRGTKIDNLVQVGHNVEVGQNTILCAQVGIAGSAKIGDHCTLAGQVGVAGHLTMGHDVQVGAQSGIPNNVKDGAVLMGYPAVPARDFAKQAVMIKQLGSLRETVRTLQQEVERLKTLAATASK